MIGTGAGKRQPSIRRQLLAWVLGALCVGAPVLALAAYLLTLHEVDEVMDDSLQQTALLLADRDLRGAGTLGSGASSFTDTESHMVAIARDPDGSLLFTSEPRMALRFEAKPGLSVQTANGARWSVYSVVQSDRVVQAAQPISVRRALAASAATQLLVPMSGLIVLIGALLVFALRRGMKPLAFTNDALARRSAQSLEPLDLRTVPVEIVPVVRTLNDLLERLSAAFEAQQNFVADAAHELRSPVTALQLQVQILERSRDREEGAVAIAELSAGIARARRLIEQLLQLSRASSVAGDKPTPTHDNVQLADIARIVVVRWTNDAERRNIDLGADTTAGVVVEADAGQLEIMLGNLVENALRYTQSGGVVDVVAETIDGAPVLRVIDDGPGIPVEERERVFDRFYRSPEAIACGEPGSGLGLAIVKSIADRHGAVVSLHAGRSGTGLEVRVSFGAGEGNRTPV